MSGLAVNGLKAIVERQKLEIEALREELHNARRFMQADRDQWDRGMWNRTGNGDPFVRTRGYLKGVEHAEGTTE